MKYFFYILFCCTSIWSEVKAQLPDQGIFNKELYAVMLGYPSKFESIKGKEIDSDYGITDYSCNVKISGAKETHLWKDEEENLSKYHFVCTIARGVSLEEAKKLYKQWQVLLSSATLEGAPLIKVSEKEEKKFIEFKSVFAWKTPTSIATNYKSFSPTLIMNREMGEKFKVIININP